MPSDRELEFLQRLARAAAETLDAPSMVELVIRETTDAVRVDVCSVYLLEPDGVSLRLTATNGLSQAGVGHVVLHIGEGITGSAASTRKPVLVPDVREDRRFRWMVGVDQARFVSMCSVPILAADRLIGVLNVQTDETRHFTISEVDFLMSIAAQVAGVFERTALQGQLEAQIAGLHRAQEIHRRFTALALEAPGLDQICEEIAAHTGLHVAVYDGSGARLTPSDDDRFPDVLPSELPGDTPFRITPIGAGGHDLGWMATCPRSDRDADARRDGMTALEHGVTVLALELSRRRAAAETEERLRGDFVEELLTPALTAQEAERIIDRGARLGYRLRRNMWVVVLIPDDDAGREALRDPERSETIRRSASSIVDTRHPGSIVVPQATEIICLVVEPAAPDHVESVAQLVAEAVSETSGGGFSAGVSGRAGTPIDLAARADEARLAHRVGRQLGRTRSVSAHRRLGAERLLLSVSPGSALSAFVDEWIGPVIAAGPDPETNEILGTLVTLTRTSWSLRETARQMDVTGQTVLARIQRAREILRRDVDDPDVRLSLALAIRALALLPHETDTPTTEAAILQSVEVTH